MEIISKRDVLTARGFKVEEAGEEVVDEENDDLYDNSDETIVGVENTKQAVMTEEMPDNDEGMIQ